MRRCDRHPLREYDPYVEFSFEKSLRKYENYPHKKIKINSESFPKINILQRQSPQYQKSRVNKSQQKQVFKQLLQKQYAQKLVALQQFKQQNGNGQHNDELIEKVSQMEINLVQVKEDQIYEELSYLKQGIQIQIQQFGVYQRQKEQQYKIPTVGSNKKEKDVIKEKQFIINQQKQNNSHNLPSEIPICTFEKKYFLQSNKRNVQETKKYIQKQGRLNLTDNISVSLRSINKFKQNGINKKNIVEKLLKRMKLTQSEKLQVSHTLCEFLEINQ